MGDFRLCFKETEVILRSLQYGHGGKVLESAFLNIGDLIVWCIETAQYCILKHSGFQPAKLIVAEGSTDKKCQQNYETMCSDKSGFLWHK